MVVYILYAVPRMNSTEDVQILGVYGHRKALDDDFNRYLEWAEEKDLELRTEGYTVEGL